MSASLIAKSILPAAIRTLPGNGIAGHSPEVFMHAILTDAETASTCPTKCKLLPTALTDFLSVAGAPGPVSMPFDFSRHHLPRGCEAFSFQKDGCGCQPNSSADLKGKTNHCTGPVTHGGCLPENFLMEISCGLRPACRRVRLVVSTHRCYEK